MWASLKKQLQEKSILLITIPAVAGAVSLVRLLGWLQPLELAALDQSFRLRPLEPTDPRIVIVGLNESDVRRYNWPISDQVLAQLLEQIKQQQPAVIGLDLYRDLPVEPGYTKLVKQYETTPNLIGIEKRGEGEEAVNPPVPLKQRDQVAVNNVFLDVDTYLRRGLLFWVNEDGSLQPSLGFRLALTYLEAKGIKLQPVEDGTDHVTQFRLGQGLLPLLQPNDGGYVNVYTDDPQVLVNFRRPAEGFETVSVSQILDGKVPANLMKDRIVLIGTTSTSLRDFFNTPLEQLNSRRRMAGVEFQANLISHVLGVALEGRSSIYTWPDGLEYLWIVVWCSVGAGLSWALRSPQLLLPALFASGGLLLTISYIAFLGSLWVPAVPALIGLAWSTGIVVVTIAAMERQERQIVMTLFGRHVTPKVADVIYQNRYELMTEGRLKGQKMVATVLFSDLKDFSTVTEQIEPDELMLWLNEYMDAMVNQVIQHGGIVDKFIGDAVMAVFGVPFPSLTETEVTENAQRAVACAIGMATALEELNERWMEQKRPFAMMRVGIATGPVITGSLGSAQRMEYTTMGDTVNVAARLESYDKSLAGDMCRILIDEETHQHIKEKFNAEFITSAQLKGKYQITQVYRVRKSASNTSS